MRSSLKIIFFSLLIVFATRVSATHIVGGEINYSYLGNNNYQISVTVYRDCYNGQAPYDDPASVGIFDNTGNLLEELLLPFYTATPLENTLNITCGDIPTNVCVEKFTYVGNANLPTRPGGYVIEYQRCCRNNTILNIVDPMSTGATFYATIPDATMYGTNSNPVITHFPPIFLCNGLPFEFDNSATDADGDQLVYQLCTPYDGATYAYPKPTAIEFTSINPVVWNLGYSANNMLGGTVPLSINSSTGLLTCTPNTTGQFVVGICVLEFRNGVLLSETKRDFQFNIVNCNFSIVAAMSVITGTTTLCEPTVVFRNNSTGATAYYWDFGDASNPFDNSTEENPTYVYPSPGTYDVTFIASNSQCADTIIKTITIFEYPIVTFGNDTAFCNSVNLTLNSGNQYSTHLWSTGATTSSIHIANPGTYWVKVGNGGCYAYDTIQISIYPLNVNLGRDTTLCNLASCILNAGNLGESYFWSTGATSHSIVVDASGSYWVSVSNSYCVVKDTVQIDFSTYPSVDLGPDQNICKDAFTTLNAGNQGNEYLWSTSETSPSIVVSLPGHYWAKVGNKGCYKTDTVTIGNLIVPVDAGKDNTLCDMQSYNLNAGYAGYTYLWSNGDTSQHTTIFTSGTYKVSVSDGNCTNTDSVRIKFYHKPEVNIGNDTVVCLGTSLTLTAHNDSATYRWSTGSTSQTINVSQKGIYTVTVYKNGCSNADSISISNNELVNLGNDGSLCDNPELTLDAGISGAKYLWITGETTQKIIVRDAGLYWVRMNLENCISTDTIEIAGSIYNTLYIPNSFTPNKDMLNEEFKVFGSGITTFSMTIFSQWGEKLFASNDINEGWKGFYNDRRTPLPLGVYAYVIEYKTLCSEEKNYRKYGHIVLIR